MIDGESVNEILESMRAASTQCAGYALRLQRALDDQDLIAESTQPPAVGVDVSDEMVERVEQAVGMGHEAWDMVDPKELIRATAAALLTGGGAHHA